MSTPQTTTTAAAPETGVKRARTEQVDPDDGTVLPNAKSSKVEIDKRKKLKVLKFIVEAFVEIHGKTVKTVDAGYKNVTIGNQITNIVLACYNINRTTIKQTTGNAETKAKAAKEFTISSKGKTYTIALDVAVACVKDAAVKSGLEFKNYGVKDKDNWYGTAGPYLDFFLGNALRLTELRLGHSNMPIKKEGDKITAFPVFKYGLTGAHHILLEGCTFPPEKRASLAQSVGPMTALLCHIRTKGIYREKWTLAAKNSMSHIPFIDEVLSTVVDKPASEIRSLISTVADILRIATPRQSQRMFFPLNMIVAIYKLPTQMDTKVVVVGTENTIYKGEDYILENFNISGNGGIYAYQIAQLLKFEIEGSYSVSQARQAVFHSIMGTFKEDLSILESITDIGRWDRREEFKNAFDKKKEAPYSVEFQLPGLNVYPRLASANLSGLLTSNYLQTSSIPVFSGYRKQHFTDEFFEQLNRRTGASLAMKTLSQLTAHLTEVLSELRNHRSSNGKMLEMGTVQWRNMGFADAVAGGAVTTGMAEGKGKFFVGPKPHYE